MKFLEWKHHIEGVEKMEGFNAPERRQAKEALQYLQTVLGNDFLSRAAPNPPVASHPILHLLANYAPSSRRDLTRFAGYLRTLEGSENLNRIVARLHDRAQFRHDALVIKSAAELVREGFQARFEPTMPVQDGQKQPDIRLDDAQTAESVFLEVAVQSSARREREAEDAAQKIGNLLNAVVIDLYNKRGGLDLRWAGRLYKTPSEPHLEEILGSIGDLARRAVSEETILQFHEEGTIDLVFCHTRQRSLFDDWCRQLGMPDGEYCATLGPPVRTNEVERIRQKIEKEQRQLPRHAMNAILILDPIVFWKARNLSALINEVEEEVYRHDHVAIVILHSEYIGRGKGTAVSRTGDHKYTRRETDGTTEENLLLLNRYARVRPSDNLMAKFRRVF